MNENDIPDVQSVIAAVAAKYGVLLEPSDVGFALVTINQMVLERTGSRVAQQIDRRLKEFEVSFGHLQERAGKLLAQDVKDCAAHIRAELQRDIDAARVNASDMVQSIEAAHSRSAVIRRVATAIAYGGALFAAGIWCGIHSCF